MITMSVTGTIALLSYFITEALFGTYIKIKWKRVLLGMTICFYTIPFANYKYQIMELVEFGCRRNVFRRQPVNGELDTEFAISYIGEQIVLGDGQKLLVGLTVVCGMVALGILFYKLYAYMSLKKIMTTYEQGVVPEKCTLYFQQAKQELHLKRNVNLCCTREISSPVTTGVWKITIWLPADVERYKENELRMILMHELGHICHWDQVFYCMGLVVVTLHWFNPISYFLLIAIRLVNEQYSDEMVTSHMIASDRIQYCKLMISEIEKTVRQPSMGIGFTGVKKLQRGE